MIISFKPPHFKAFAIVAISFLGILVYSNTFHSPFLFDDENSIVKNFSIRNLSNLKAILDFCSTRFIAYLSVAVNYHFGKLDVFGYHLFNIFVHVSSALAVWWLTLLTLSTPAMKNQRIANHSRLIALFVGLLFVSHPIQTESVTYIIQRTASLAALFYILSVCLYAKSRLSENKTIALSCYALSLLSALLAMFTKEFTATLPIAVVLYELFFIKSGKKTRWIYLLPFLAMIFIIPVTMILAKPLAVIEEQTVGSADISSLDYLFTQFRVITTYLRLLLWPIHQNLDYDYPVYKSLFSAPVLWSLSLLLALFSAAVFWYKRHRLLSFAICWFFLALSVESSVVPLRDVIFEHRLYLPMAGFSIFLVSAAYYIFGNRGVRLVFAILSVAVILYSILTYSRNVVWNDEFTFWNDVIRKSPGKARPYINRGKVYQDKGKIDQAISDYSQAIKLIPKYTMAYNNRGNAYLKKGDFAKAISDCNKAIELNPEYAKAYYNRAIAYFLRQDYEKAWKDVRRTEALGQKVHLALITNLKKASGKDGL